MNIEILEQKNNPVMRREEIKILVFGEKTPSFSEASKLLSEKFKKPEENIDIKKIKGKFGRKSFLISAFLYDNPELKKRFSIKKTKKTSEKGEEQKTEEKKETKTKEEKPAEKPSEKVEKKPEHEEKNK